jgi:glutamate-1-semialdehyde 2,1-aminomutase
LRQACTENDIILIFDEVMTSRLSSGGLQAALGVTPDMTTLGKYLGGGLSFGAFGGRGDIMQNFDPEQPSSWPHAGTFNNNVLSMAAGLTGLRDLCTPEVIAALNEKGEKLRNGVGALAEKHNVPMVATGSGSIANLHFSDHAIRSIADIDPASEAKRKMLHKLMHLDLIAGGQFLARRGYISLNIAMTEAHIDGFLAALEEFIVTRRSLLAD